MRNRKMILTLIVLLVVGFASVSTTLFLNGVIGISGNEDDFKIIFTSAKLNNKKRNDFISEDKKSINFETDKLTTVDEEAYLDYEVTNTSRLYDGEVVISCIVPENDYVIVDYQPRSMTVNAGETENGRITARLLKASAEDGSISIECTLNATATERDSLGDEYIESFSRSGVLMKATNTNNSPTGLWQYRSNITKVVFENTMNEHETNEELIFDVSSAQDESVMAYLVPNGENLTTTKDGYTGKELEDATAYTLYIQSDTGVKANPNSSSLFANFNNLTNIEGLVYLDTSNVTNMSDMFWYCSSLTSLDLNNFDTSNVTDMSFMFYNCRSLTSLDLSNCDTSSVINMGSMFGGVTSLTTLDLSNFDTSKVTNMAAMFGSASSLTTIDLSSFDTSNVTSMVSMFSNCRSLTALDLNNFDTSNVIGMSNMFYYCSKLTSLNVSNFDTSNVKDMQRMFYYCKLLTNLDVSNFDTSNVTTMESMFESCSSLILLDVSHFNTNKVTNMMSVFDNCSSLVSLDVSNFDTTNVTNMAAMFYNCSSLASLDVNNFDTANVTNMASIFNGCQKLTELNLGNFDTSNVTNMYAMFYNCNNLIVLDISNFSISNVTNVSSMFYKMSTNVKIKVKDEEMQTWILNSDNSRPSSWTTDNIIIA